MMPGEPEGPKNYYAIRIELVHVRKGRFKFNEKTRQRISYLNTEAPVKQLWKKIEDQIQSMGNTVEFRNRPR